jgi:hypothetical protein
VDGLKGEPSSRFQHIGLSCQVKQQEYGYGHDKCIPYPDSMLHTSDGMIVGLDFAVGVAVVDGHSADLRVPKLHTKKFNLIYFRFLSQATLIAFSKEIFFALTQHSADN